jgi:hypothetical protein
VNIRRFLINSLTILISIFSLISCIGNTKKDNGGGSQLPETLGPLESNPSNTSSPIIVKLILSKPPRLNEQAKLTIKIFSIFDAPDIKAFLILPEGTNLIDGEREWTGALKANEMKTLYATIMFITEGDKTIQAKAHYYLDNGDVWGDAAYLYLNTTKESGKVGFSSQQNSSSSTSIESPLPANTDSP